MINFNKKTGIYNLGTGKARSWNDIANSMFAAVGRPANIEYIEMPEILQEKYQYFTQAEMRKLRDYGCPMEFYSLEHSVHDYVCNYLQKTDPHLGNEL